MNAITNDMLTAERRAFADLARDFSAKSLIEGRENHDRYPFGDLMERAIADAATVGFFGINLPADFGGVEMNASMLAAILVMIAREDASMAGILFANAAALEIIRAASAEAPCSDIYGAMASLGVVPVAFQSYASPDEEDLPVVNECGIASGTVRFLALGPFAEYAVVPARSGDESSYSYYLLHLKAPGVRVGDPLITLGFHACPAADVSLDCAPVRLIGRRGGGDAYHRAMRDSLSIAAAAISLGILKGAQRDAVQYAADRYQGGRQIIEWGQVRMMLANMAIESKAAECCLETACRELDAGLHGWEETAMAAAIHAGELAVRATADGVQLFGGNGYTKDYPQEKRMRDARQAHALLGMAPFRKMAFADRVIADGE